MKKITMMALSLFAVVILSGCTDQKETDQAKQSIGDKKAEKTSKQQTASTSLMDLLKKDSNLKCQWSNSTEQGEYMKGVVYISGEKFRQEMDFSQNNDGGKSYVISDGASVYMWTSGTNKGTKMTTEEMKQNQNQNQVQEKKQEQQKDQTRMNISQKFEYDCDNWNADQSKFETPNGIEFVDLNQQMNKLQKGLMNQGSGQNQDPCTMCDSLPSSAKESCLQSCQ